MKNFLKNIALRFLIPFLIVVFFFIAWDPFKVFFNYTDFYNNNRIATNREYVCYQLFNKNKNTNNLENFIIGSSRSRVFDTKYWSKFLGVNNTSCFHYDGSTLGLFRARNALNYIAGHVKKINNILLIVDTDFFNETINPKGHLYMQPPEISKESKLNFYLNFFKSSTDFKFMLANLISKLSRDNYYVDFMSSYILKVPDNNLSNNVTGDYKFRNEKMIQKDSVGYYAELFRKGIFYSRSKTEKVSSQTIKDEQKKMLGEIRSLVEQEKINIKILISPLYSQLKFNAIDLAYLKNTFGSKNVFDFSGINYITANPLNYFESSHFKPYIANMLMNYVYNLKSDKLNAK